jgi:hypothetical protein
MYVTYICRKMDNEIENAYREALKMEIGNLNTNSIRSSIYRDEQAFALQVHCIRQDYPPPNTVSNERYYKIEIKGLSHGTLMLILTSLRDILTLEYCAQHMHILSYGTKKSIISKELSALGVSHMGKWITHSKDNTYTLTIRYITYKICSTISKILFQW